MSNAPQRTDRRHASAGEDTNPLRLLPLARVRGLAALALLVTAQLAGGQAAHAQQPWPLWEAYTAHYLDGQGRVIDHNAGDRTTSEGQAYALFFALVDDDHARFEKVLAWTQGNLAGGDLTSHLPAWDWGRTATGEWKVRDPHSAADADLWMAYTLIEAGRLWTDPRLGKLGHLLAQRIAREEVVIIPGLGTTLSPGSAGFHPDKTHWVLNPSYLPLPVVALLAHEEPHGPWAGVLRSLPKVVGGPATHGFAMDWVVASPDGVKVAAAPLAASTTAGAQPTQPVGSYDAIRVYLWLGLADPLTPGRADLLAALPGMGAAVKVSAVPPLAVAADGRVLRADAPVGFSAALAPYLQALGLKAEAASEADRVVAMRNPATGLVGAPVTYYDQNLTLFSTGFSQGRFRFLRDGRLQIHAK